MQKFIFNWIPSKGEVPHSYRAIRKTQTLTNIEFGILNSG